MEWIHETDPFSSSLPPGITARLGKCDEAPYDIFCSSDPNGIALFLIEIDGQFFDRGEDMIG
jgi:hypothetical protein